MHSKHNTSMNTHTANYTQYNYVHPIYNHVHPIYNHVHQIYNHVTSDTIWAREHSDSQQPSGPRLQPPDRNVTPCHGITQTVSLTTAVSCISYERRFDQTYRLSDRKLQRRTSGRSSSCHCISRQRHRRRWSTPVARHANSVTPLTVSTSTTCLHIQHVKILPSQCTRLGLVIRRSLVRISVQTPATLTDACVIFYDTPTSDRTISNRPRSFHSTSLPSPIVLLTSPLDRVTYSVDKQTDRQTPFPKHNVSQHSIPHFLTETKFYQICKGLLKVRLSLSAA